MIPEELKSLNDLDQIVFPMGWVAGTAAGDVTVRFCAGSRTNFVQVHIQTADIGYNSAVSVASVEVDCRGSRWQTYTFSRGAADYYVYLIPVFRNDAGSTTKFDGVDGPDHMASMEIRQ